MTMTNSTNKTEIKKWIDKMKKQKVQNKMMPKPVENKKTDTKTASKLIYKHVVEKKKRYLLRVNMAKQELELPQGAVIEIYEL